MDFFVRNIFKKYMKFARRENKKKLGALNKKSYHYFTTLEFLHQGMLWFKEMRFVQYLEATIKRCSENWHEDARGWVHFEELKLYEMCSSSQTLQCIFFKSFQKHQHVAL